MTPYASRDRSVDRAASFATAGAGLTQPPTPTLPLGAGGPRVRAAGWVLPAAAAAVQVLERDELLRLHAAAAAADLGPISVPGGPGVVFVGLDDAQSCPRLSRRGAAPAVPAGVVGYVAGAPALAAAHRLHACCNVVLLLRASGGRPCFTYPPPGALAGASLSAREADVLVLLLAGHTDAEVGARLCVSPDTARAHARAVLRKLGAPDRRALRARLLGRAPPDAG